MTTMTVVNIVVCTLLLELVSKADQTDIPIELLCLKDTLNHMLTQEEIEELNAEFFERW